MVSCGGSFARFALRQIEKGTRDMQRCRKNRKRKHVPPEKKVPMFIRELGLAKEGRRSVVLKELLSLTGREFGADRAAWKRWYEDNRGRSRAEWCADVLEENNARVYGERLANVIPACIRALQHASPGVRAAAYYMLRRVTGRTMTFAVRASEETRTGQVRNWAEWWISEGAKFLERRNGA